MYDEYFEGMKTTGFTLIIAGIVAIVLTSAIGTLTLATAAQLKNLQIKNTISTYNSTVPFNMPSGQAFPILGPVMNPGSTANINNGSTSLIPLMAKAIISQVRVGTGNATIIAEKAIGYGSHTVSANLGIDNNFLVHIIIVLDNNSNFHRVIVDVGTGKVLSSILLPQPMSIMDIIGGPGQSSFNSANRMFSPGMISPSMSLSLSPPSPPMSLSPPPPPGGLTLPKPFP